MSTAVEKPDVRHKEAAYIFIVHCYMVITRERPLQLYKSFAASFCTILLTWLLPHFKVFFCTQYYTVGKPSLFCNCKTEAKFNFLKNLFVCITSLFEISMLNCGSIFFIRFELFIPHKARTMKEEAFKERGLVGNIDLRELTDKSSLRSYCLAKSK